MALGLEYRIYNSVRPLERKMAFYSHGKHGTQGKSKFGAPLPSLK